MLFDEEEINDNNRVVECKDPDQDGLLPEPKPHNEYNKIIEYEIILGKLEGKTNRN